jgi:hypothetical protein
LHCFFAPNISVQKYLSKYNQDFYDVNLVAEALQALRTAMAATEASPSPTRSRFYGSASAETSRRNFLVGIFGGNVIKWETAALDYLFCFWIPGDRDAIENRDELTINFLQKTA